MGIRILITDDHQIVREGLRALLEKQPDIEVLAEADNGRDAVRLAREMAPDIVVMDVGMPGLNGIEATRQITSCTPRARVLALSMHSDPRFVKRMLCAGADGYVLKDGAFEELAQAIKTLAAGECYLSPEVATVVLRGSMRRFLEPEASDQPQLTPREREVLQLVSEGHSNKEIAESLHVSVKTVEHHRSKIMSKVHLHSIAELTKYAVREGLTFLEQ